MNRIDGGRSDCALVMQGLHLPATHTSRGREWKRKNFARSHTSSQKAEFILKDHLPGNLIWGLQTGGPLPTDGLCSKKTQLILIDWSPRCFSAPQTSRKKKEWWLFLGNATVSPGFLLGSQYAIPDTVRHQLARESGYPESNDKQVLSWIQLNMESGRLRRKMFFLFGVGFGFLVALKERTSLMRFL